MWNELDTEEDKPMMWSGLRHTHRAGQHDLTHSERNADPFALMRERMDQMFDDMIGATAWRTGTEMAPRVDVTEKNGVLTIEAELPGVQPEEVAITLNDNILTIKGEFTAYSKRITDLFRTVAEIAFDRTDVRLAHKPIELGGDKVHVAARSTWRARASTRPC